MACVLCYQEVNIRYFVDSYLHEVPFTFPLPLINISSVAFFDMELLLWINSNLSAGCS